MQWNLDSNLTVEKFKFNGLFSANNSSDYDRILRDFFRDSVAMSRIQIEGTPSGVPLVIESQQVSTNVMSMEFFDRLENFDIISTGGQIRGCFEEYFDGIQCGDKLREVLLNEDSENASIYTPSDKLELIYILFRIFVVGGSMCQPDTRVGRYLDMAKAFYKDILTVYKDSATNAIAVSGRVLKIKSVPGMSFFSHPDKDIVNLLLVVVDPMKKHLLVVKSDYKPFW